MTNFLESEIDDLRRAKLILENPGLVARLANFIGKPIEIAFNALPENWRDIVAIATKKALLSGLEVSMTGLDKNKKGSPSNLLNKLLVIATGGGGGAIGLPALPVELPISTCIMLRSIADIARSEGHNIELLDVKLNCLAVLALGGDGDDTNESKYWAVRAILSKALAEAAEFLATKGIIEEGAPAIVRLIATIAQRFSVIVSEEVAAKGIPIVGALGGAAINYLFMDLFQDMAAGHFIVKRLESKYGIEDVKDKYNEIVI